MKIFFLLAFLALVVNTAIAQYAEVPSPAARAPTADASGEWVAIAPSASGSENCEEEQPKLDSCSDYVMDRCVTKDMPLSWVFPQTWGKRSCEEVQNQCCQQLRQTTPRCRCKAIWTSIQGDLSGFKGLQQGLEAKMVQTAKSLPSKCNIDPKYCNIPITSGYYW
uniref:Puroindoline n=1 Tax=Secale cereale x Triticum turgidum subsp. durum TaxID=142809 RepID=A0A7D5FX87_9POAL|nr:puroindoline [Secale cereale x Triticum turgidum subsp. durum]